MLSIVKVTLHPCTVAFTALTKIGPMVESQQHGGMVTQKVSGSLQHQLSPLLISIKRSVKHNLLPTGIGPYSPTLTVPVPEGMSGGISGAGLGEIVAAGPEIWVNSTCVAE